MAMATITVERKEVIALLEDWMQHVGEGADKLEVMVLPHEVVIREPNERVAQFDSWIDDYFARRESLMKRLADA